MVNAETGEIITAGADLVPAANMADLDALDPVARDLAVSRMLDQAHAWLAHAKEASLPAQDIANFRAFVATAEEASRRVKVSKEIQLDAAEMLRRAERELGLAIKRGQDRGEIRRRARPKSSALEDLASPYDFVAGGATIDDIHKMADSSEEAFEAALSDAKAEGNPGRANVVRKIQGKAPPQRGATVEQVNQIKDLAARGYHSEQIAAEVGISVATVRKRAKRHDIDLHADAVMGQGAGKKLDSTRIAQKTVMAISGVALSLSLIDYDSIIVTPETKEEWDAILKDSLPALTRFSKKIKEMTPHVQSEG